MARKRIPLLIIAIAIAGVAITGSALGAAGRLDHSFSKDGKVRTDFGASGFSGASAILALPEGRLMALGRAGNGSAADFALAKYRSNGRRASSFGGGDGKVTTDLPGSDEDAIRDAVAGPGGTVIAAGRTGPVASSDFAIARYEGDGDLDPTFNPGGALPGTNSFGFPGGTDDEPGGIVRAAEGKLVVAGVSEEASEGDFALVRFDANGTVDMAGGFGTLGVVETDVSGASDYDAANDIAARENGKLLVAGFTYDGTTTDADFALVRYREDGSVDDGFGGGDGIVTVGFGTDVDVAHAVALQENGRILLAGQARTSSPETSRFALARFTAKGHPDPSFGGGDGKVTTNFPGNPIDVAFDVVVKGDGSIVAAGVTQGGGNGGDFAVARYEPSGRRDRSFSKDGRATTSFSSLFDSASALLVRKGKIIVAGTGGEDFALARYLGR